MIEKEFIIANQEGLHARPASELVKLANSFKCELRLTYNGVEVDLKSIMGLLSLGVPRGSQITVRAEGIDELEAMKAISKQLNAYNLK